MRIKSVSMLVVFCAAILVFAGCGDDSPAPATGRVSLSLNIPAASPPAGRTVAAAAYTDLSGNNLTIQTAVVVLREIEFERLNAPADCDDPAGDEDCSEFSTPPVLVTLPVDGTTDVVITATVPADTYDEIEFDVHKPSSDDPEDAAFVLENPGVDYSVKVTGTYNGSAFDFTSDLNEEQERQINPPIVVTDGAVVNVTLTLDMDTWFRDAQQTLVDPQTANKGGINENLVKENIKVSVDAFEDDDHDGVHD